MPKLRRGGHLKERRIPLYLAFPTVKQPMAMLTLLRAASPGL